MLPLLLALAALLVLPPAAAADEEVARGGAVEARVSYTRGPDREFRDLRLAVTRAGAAVYGAPVRSRACGEPSCFPIGAIVEGVPSLRVLDLDGDAEPEVLLELASGGVHCCVVSQVLRWTGAAYAVTERNFLDAGYELTDLGGDGRLEFRSSDARFRERFASFAASGFPLRVLRFAAGRFVDVTASFPDLIARDARSWDRRYRARRRARDGEQLGVLAAWAADQYRLGRRAAVLRRLRGELRRGYLRGPGGGRRYVRDLDRFLRRLGYARSRSASSR